MKALSIKQPYAGLIMAGIKDIENRSWQTSYRGTLAIVATKSPATRQDWQEDKTLCEQLGHMFPARLCAVNGSILGTVELIGILSPGEPEDRVITAPGAYGDWLKSFFASATQAAPRQITTGTQALNSPWHIPDCYGWILSYPRQLVKPIPITGRLGLYNLPETVTRQFIFTP